MRYMRPRAVVVVVALGVAGVVLSLAGPAWAQAGEPSRRLERLFSFEETDDRGVKIGFSGQVLPRHWYVIGRPALGADGRFRDVPLHEELVHRRGYPDFSEVGYDRDHAVSGDFSLRLGLTGGSTGAFVEVGAIPAIASSDYLLTGWVRTEKLDHAWAEARVYFIDCERRRIERSVHRSEPFQTGGEWSPIAIKLRGDYEGAEYIGVELVIVQPGMDEDSVLGARQVVPQDIDGGAWFDDIALWKLPHVELRTQSPTNVIAAPQVPEVTATVRDLSGQRMRARLSVYDHRGQLVDRQDSAVGAGTASSWAWTPRLPGFGWYFTEILVSEDDGSGSLARQIEHSIGAMLYLPEDPGDLGPDLSRFMLVAEGMPDDRLALLGALLEQTGLNGAVVSAWDRRSTPSTLMDRQALLDPIIRDLTVSGGRAVVSLHPVPVDLSARSATASTDPLAVLLDDETLVEPYLKPVLMRHGQRVSDWQLGTSDRPDAFYSGALGEDLATIDQRIGLMAPSPRLVVPWRLDQAGRPTVHGSDRAVAMAWHQGVTPSALRDAMDTWPVPPADVRLDLRLADADQMRHEQRLTDLVLRMLHAWEHQPGALGLPAPWTDGHERRAALLPDPALGVWTTTARRLAGQRVVGWMPLGDGLRCMILDGEQGGMLAVWNHDAPIDAADIALTLGDAPVEIDLFGNRRELPAEADGKHVLTIGRTPRFITGIDPTLARFRAGFALDDPFIESRQDVHRRTLTLANPWPRTITGRYTLTGPDHWDIQPRMHHFAIAPGGTIRVPIAMRFPIHEPGGHKQLTAHVSFDADRPYDIDLAIPIELGLRDIDFESSVALEPGSTPGTTDAVVTLSVTNRGDTPTALYLFATARDRPRREVLVPSIAPGEFATRRVRFTDVGDLIGDAPLRCGVREADGPAVLNRVHRLDVRE